MKNKTFSLILICFTWIVAAQAQDMENSWDKNISRNEHPNIQWFKDAKFGLFIHWGLYSKLGGVWMDKNYYGSGEWIMNVAKANADAYAEEAANMDLSDYNPEEWAMLAKKAGIKYVVITAKHHEGFTMYDSKVSDFTIVKSTKYGKDPMLPLSQKIREQGIEFGFYYSQFLDWHEPNGGGNRWDFDESKKDYQEYYSRKAIPQLKELLSNYGPLGTIWFDMPGGLTYEQTKSLVDTLRKIQPNCLFSSRVGQGLGDYRDFGDSEVPGRPIHGAWESIYTHNDSWGFIAHDKNFKSPKEIIQLLAEVASKGGNLMLNVGPDGKGAIPAYSRKYLLEVGKWLDRFGDGIYKTTYGFIPRQPWGVTTSKPGKLYLHIFDLPENHQILVPGMNVDIQHVYQLDSGEKLSWNKNNDDLTVPLPVLTDSRNTVVVVEYAGVLTDKYDQLPVTVSAQYRLNKLLPNDATREGAATIKSITHSDYFGNWKHTTCLTEMKKPEDVVHFNLRFTDPGDYKIMLSYNCEVENSRQEGVIEFNKQRYLFQTVRTGGKYTNKEPLMFHNHHIAIVTVTEPGVYSLKIYPLKEGKELFKLQSIQIDPLK
ncbi:MAG: alpha-L-fucosidase [Bacteroidetes bacterium GWC1_47_7]|nr:MAG: alpha-L-fucosidase [Bacteroidetes bacterium GWC1_47_7]